MTTTSDNTPLVALSQNLAAIVEQAGSAVVAVNARRRRPSSGVHWRPGIVVTADHTVRDEDITIGLADGRSVVATLLGRDSGSDLAVLQFADPTDAPTIPSVAFADAATLQVGHMVLAIARGESGVSASLGVVGAIGSGWRSWHGSRIDHWIRPALMLYPGSAGGALVDSNGRIVGLNTVGPRHLALTIPASTVDRVVDRLLSGGRLQRGYLGLGMQSVTLPDTLIQSLNLSQRTGVIIVSLEPDGPAATAGIMIGDILVALNETSIEDVGEVHTLLDPDQVGKPLTAHLIRGGQPTTVTITVGERPGSQS